MQLKFMVFCTFEEANKENIELNQHTDIHLHYPGKIPTS